MFDNKNFVLSLLKCALDENLYGKRKRDTKLEAVENFRPALVGEYGLGVPDAPILLDWLEVNKPVKAAAEKRAKAETKPAASTMAGNETRDRDNIAIIQGSKFIVTSAQNNTLPSSVLKQLISAASDLEAQLVILPTYYNRKAFSATAEDENEYFDNAVKPYLIESDHWLGGENVVKVAAQAIVPLTTKQPINAAQTLNNGELVTIVGHPKQQQKTLLRMAGEEIKTAWSTASCTSFNYLRGRAGSEAENFHAFGGVLVEIIGGKAFCTNLCQSQDGSLMFYDQDGELYSYGYSSKFHRPLVTVGDSHFEVFDKNCFASVCRLIERTKAKQANLHDIAHFASRSHHAVGSSSHWYKNKAVSILDELKFIIGKVNEYAKICDIYIVESNHNAAVDIWLNNQQTAQNITYDTNNSKLFYLLKYLVCEAIDEGNSFNGLELSFKNADLVGLETLAENVRFGKAHIPEIHHNTDFCSHGHKGANGAAKGLTTGKISQSMVLGHTHSPEISYMTSRGGIVTQGTTAKMDQGYNRGGGSSWGQASAITHMNGITQIHFHAL